MTSTFTRLAGLAGLLGSLALVGMMVAPVLFPNNDILSAPFYGGGALLLALFGVGLYRAGSERTGTVAKAGMVVAIAAFVSIAIVAVLDIFSRTGLGNFDWLWSVLMVSTGLMFGGLAVYAIGAMAARAIPGWAGIPLAVGGAGFVLLLIASIIIGDRAVDAAGQVFSTAATASVVLVTAAVAALGLMLTLERPPAPAESPGSLARPST
jgi:hypothetical protein